MGLTLRNATMIILKVLSRTPYRQDLLFILNMDYPRGCLKYRGVIHNGLQGQVKNSQTIKKCKCVWRIVISAVGCKHNCHAFTNCFENCIALSCVWVCFSEHDDKVTPREASRT
jgi:hypothetical protein